MSTRTIHSPILNALEPAARDSLLRRARQREFKAGSTLFLKGDAGGWLYLIEQGLVEIGLLSPQGKKAVLNHLGPGELIGELAVLDRLPRSADAVALTDTRGLVIAQAGLVDLLGQDNSACLEIIRLLCARVRNASDRFESRAVAPAPVRLAGCLLTLARKWGEPVTAGSVRITQRFSQSDLGDIAGLARENVNRLIKDWQAAGWVAFHRGELTLLDADALHDLMETGPDEA